MSLTMASKTFDEISKCPTILKTADQYQIWKARVTDVCWVATHRNVFELTDDDCVAGLKEYEPEQKTDKSGKEAKKPEDWVGRCWMIITASLHDEVYLKVNHVRRGLIQSLLAEINSALVINNLEEVQPLRME